MLADVYEQLVAHKLLQNVGWQGTRQGNLEGRLAQMVSRFTSPWSKYNNRPPIDQDPTQVEMQKAVGNYIQSRQSVNPVTANLVGNYIASRQQQAAAPLYNPNTGPDPATAKAVGDYIASVQRAQTIASPNYQKYGPRF